MGVDLGGFHVAVAEEFLDGADIVAVFDEVGREGVAKGVAAYPFGDAGFEDGLVDGALEDRFVHMVAALGAGLGVAPAALLREHPLPGPFGSAVGVFKEEGFGEGNPAESVGEIAVMDLLDGPEMFAERRLEGFGEHRRSILRAFSAADHDLVTIEIDVLNAEVQAFTEAETGAVHELRGEPRIGFEMGQHRADFVAAHHDRQPDRFLRADDAPEIAYRATEDGAIEEEQGRERLVLGRSAHVLLDREPREEGIDRAFGHDGRHPLGMERQEAPDPMDIRLFGAGTVMVGIEGFFQLGDR